MESSIEVTENTDPALAGTFTPVWMKRVPMITGVLAGLAGFLTVRSNNMSNQANYSSTQAVMHQSKASDTWNQYQADSLKKHTDQVALMIGVHDPKDQQKLEAEVIEKQQNEEVEKPLAIHEEQLSKDEDFDSRQKLMLKDFLDYAGVAAQLGIALASVAALTKKKFPFNFGLFAGAVAIAVTGYALAAPYLTHLFGHH